MEENRLKINELLARRDLINFIKIRNSHPGDDLVIGELLVKTFRATYEMKLPSITTTPEREIELRNVSSRRFNGVVRVSELGFQIIGTYALISPGSALDESWTADTCTLRCVAIDPQFHSLKLSEKLILDAIDVAQRWKSRGICLHVQDGADGVARLYRQFGFERDVSGDKISMGNAIQGYLLKFQ